MYVCYVTFPLKSQRRLNVSDCMIGQWVCLSDRDDGVSERLGRTRLVLRLMRVARKLGVESWRRLERCLFGALVSGGAEPDEGREWIEAETVWRGGLGEGGYRGFVCED